jgi:hypothetical protein
MKMIGAIFRPTLASLLATGPLHILSGCGFAVPIPWAPSDPFTHIKEEFEKGDLSRGNILEHMGEPWAAIGDRTFVYITSKPSSYLYDPEDPAVLTTKDFVLIFDFDDRGVAENYESYADSFLHEHCFENGVCLSRKTLNAPLLPSRFDQESKLYEAKPNECSVYVFRDVPESYGHPENDYVEILVKKRGADRPLKRAVSVESGYSHWNLPAQSEYTIETDFKGPRFYPFDTKARTSKRKDLALRLQCEPAELLFVRFVLPSSKRIPAILELVPNDVGQAKVSQSSRLVDLYSHFR